LVALSSFSGNPEKEPPEARAVPSTRKFSVKRTAVVNPQSALERCQLLLQGAFSAAAGRGYTPQNRSPDHPIDFMELPSFSFYTYIITSVFSQHKYRKRLHRYNKKAIILRKE
jgi:hypothetical protein